MLLEREVYDKLVQQTADSREYARSISGVKPIVSSEVETEIRLKPFAPRRSHDPGAHERIKNFCLRTPREIIYESTTVYNYDDNLRRIVDNDTSKEIYQRKTQTYKQDNIPFSIRYSVSREDQLVGRFSVPGKPQSIRKRKRTRILYEGLYVDLTISTSSGNARNRESETAYEVEIEIPRIEDYDYTKLNSLIRTFFRVLRDTECPYPIAFYNMIADFYNNTLSQEVKTRVSPVSGEFDGSLQSRARTLKTKDLVYGGIVGPDVHYSVTPKADGVRTSLMLHNSGVWMYYGNGMLNCLLMTRIFEDYHGTILDVESIPMLSRTEDEAKKYQHFVVAFDVLSLGSNFARGSTNVQSKPHQERMMIAETICAAIDSRISKVKPYLILPRTKIFYYSIAVDQFFDAVRSARKLIETQVLPYKTDGLVFTPSNLKSVPYPGIEKIPPNKRLLVDYPDIVKFKPAIMLTIDFAVDIETRTLYSTGFEGRLVEFTARGFNSTENVAWETCEEKQFPKNTIVEFEWRDEQFHPIRLRNDKEKPNKLLVARDNFDNIHENLTYETLCGENTVLLRKYHNRVKTLLYTTAARAREQVKAKEGKTESGTYTLLDLGSGEGGDIMKWVSAGFTDVIAVEPSTSNIEKFEQRIRNFMLEPGRLKLPEIEILNAGAEDTERILSCAMKTLDKKPKVDVISSMLSASFFWQSDETLRNTVKTIKDHSKKGTLFLIFTINGQLIQETFNPSMREGIVLESPLVLGDITLEVPFEDWKAKGDVVEEQRFKTGRAYYITHKGSKTVHSLEDPEESRQKEYMVYIPQLTAMLSPEFVIKSHEIANKEPLLPGPLRIASSLYSYAVYERVV